MKTIPFFFIALNIILSCSNSSKENSKENIDPIINYRQEMRDFVIAISTTAKTINPDFIVIPQNGIELITSNGEETGTPMLDYINAIDGNGQEDLFYGYTNEDQATPKSDTEYLKSFLNISKNSGNTILVTDYCSTPAKMLNSIELNAEQGYFSFAANHKNLDNIPDYPENPINENIESIEQLSQIKNFLYLINPENYGTKTQFVSAVSATNYDLIIIDLFFKDGSSFTKSEINSLKTKANGGKRLVICYMSIGEAEDYRYYWNSNWNTIKPDWMDNENPNWAGNYKVNYWNSEWQAYIFGNENAYLNKILNSDFDGVYLDIIDAFDYYENLE